ncbi:MAG: hypothetical protein EXR76_02785 [Myxococcales bacterium]|nr:hypothetical protein [Myxococcales bacterium]
MGISVGGLASGLDVNAIIGQLMSLEQRAILQNQRKIAIAESKQAAFNDLDGRLNSLRNTSRSLNDESLFRRVSGTTSNDEIATISATKDAAARSFTIQVQQIAQRHQVAAQGIADQSAGGIAAAAGQFRFRIGNGAEHTVAVDNTTTLRQFADAVNALKTDVYAEIVNDGSPSNPYRVVLNSKKDGLAGQVNVLKNDTTLNFATKQIEGAVAGVLNSGSYTGAATSLGTYTGTTNSTYVVEAITTGVATNQVGVGATFRVSTDGGISFTDNGGAGFMVDGGGELSLGNGVRIALTDDGSVVTAGDRYNIDVFNPQLQSAQDAVVKINGINVTKSTNTITDFADGVTINLKKATPGTNVTLNVTENVGDVETKLTQFIGSYNSVVGFLNAQFAYNPTSNTSRQGAPPLNGDSAARQVQSKLKQFVTGRISNLDSRTLSSLSELGIESNEKTGLLSLNTSELEEKLDGDPAAVQRLLTRFGEGMSGAKFSYLRRSSKSRPGEYEVNVTQARTRAEVAGIAAIDQNLTQNETLTINYKFDATDIAHNGTDINVGLQMNDSPATVVNRLNQAFVDNNFKLDAYLDPQNVLRIRAEEYGDDYAVSITSTEDDSGGSAHLTAAAISGAGSKLVGTVGGRPARVLDETHLKGAIGFDAEDVEVVIADDTSGLLGRVRIVDGLGESLPDVLDTFMAGRGILKSRTAGLTATIEDLEAQIVKQGLRLEKVETRIRRQFTSLEVTMGQLQATGAFVTAQLAAMSPRRK